MKKFREAYDMAPHGKTPEIRAEIMDLCGWNTSETYYAKMNGKLRIRKPEMVMIKTVFTKHNIDAETGEYIHSVSLETAAIKI